MISLYVGNISYDLDEEGLAAAFQERGFTIERARLIMDRETGRPKGFGFVDIADSDAIAAVRAMDGLRVAGRPIKVAPATGRKDDRPRRPQREEPHWEDEERGRRQRDRGRRRTDSF